MKYEILRVASEKDLKTLPRYQNVRRAPNTRFSRILLATDADPDG
jgi:hypothetical protein